MGATPKRVYEQPIKPYQNTPREQSQQFNPYNIQSSIRKQPEVSLYKEVKTDFPIISDINYCRYCGEKVDRDAKFCHQCGIKL